MDSGFKFNEVAARSGCEKWDKLIERVDSMYKRESDIRSEFGRDYTRILHSTAYRRLKHKTQVFFATQNDHICTRIEHVSHVESVSFTIANELALNTELTKAIATGHDLGHSPFGHAGEQIIEQLAAREKVGDGFWHERNGLRFVDNIELLENEKGIRKNLNLTYAVRDGIISHCGEVDQNALRPREEDIDLDSYKTKNQYAPYTWEGCVVKVSDKIAYLGRDIEDARTLGLLTREDIDELQGILNGSDRLHNIRIGEINNTVLIHHFIMDLCENSTPQKGICLSKDTFKAMNEIKKFNYKRIYKHERLQPFVAYATLVINELYSLFIKCYDGKNTPKRLQELAKYYPEAARAFLEWIEKYWDITTGDRRKELKLGNKIIYRAAENKADYALAVIDYIAGMTDVYAIKTYNEIIAF